MIRLAIIGAAALLTLFAAAEMCGAAHAGGVPVATCAPPEAGDVPSNVVIVLLDKSRSADAMSVRDAYASDFDQKILYALGDKGGAMHFQSSYVAVGAIDSDTAGHFNPLQCTFPHVGGNDNPLLMSMKVHALAQQVQDQAHGIINTSHPGKGTAILDGLTAASNLAKPYNAAENKYLIVFSDMIEESDRMTMTNARLAPVAVKKFIHQQWAAGKLPSLAGYRVYVVGAGESGTRTTHTLKRDLIQRFWTKYLRAAGASVDSANWNGRLIRFP